jgi:hypothetical protein
MATEKPTPPFLPESESQFMEHITTHPTNWYKYCQAAYDFIESHWHRYEELEDHVTRLQAHVTELESQLRTAETEKATLAIAVESPEEPYREELNLSSRGLFEAKLANEKDFALAQSTASTTAPGSKPDPAIKAAADHAARTTTASHYTRRRLVHENGFHKGLFPSLPDLVLRWTMVYQRHQVYPGHLPQLRTLVQTRHREFSISAS